MEFRDSRWIDESGKHMKEHKHDHHNWHLVGTKHRSLKLNVVYPEKHWLLRSGVFQNVMIFSPLGWIRSDEEREKAMEAHMRELKIPQTIALVTKLGGPIEIYMDKLIDSVVEMNEANFKYPITDHEAAKRLILDNIKEKYGIEVRDEISDDYIQSMCDIMAIPMFIFKHEWVYIHEILHRMWHWETTYRQNKRRDKEEEEEIVDIIAVAIAFQGKFARDVLFSIDDIEKKWDEYKVKLKEVT